MPLLQDTEDRDLAMITVGEVAKLTGLSPSSIRQYESLGLVLPNKRRGRRFYSLSDIEWIRSMREYFRSTHTGPHALAQLLRCLPGIEIRQLYAGLSDCTIFGTDEAICWQTRVRANPEEVSVCRSCPTYRRKAMAMTPCASFSIRLRVDR